MSLKNDFLYLVWKDPQTRRNFTIGKLSRGEGYAFQYCEEYSLAEEAGWGKLEAFPEDQVYKSENMFPVFSSRLPDRKRRDIDKILEKYNLQEFDEFELLRKSGARLPIDTYEFINPIFPSDETIEREFFVMGIRHRATCNGVDCKMLPNVNPGDLLVLEEEPQNTYDPHAIRVLTKDGECLGYIPRYYSKSVHERLLKGTSYSCKVVEVQANHCCTECVKVKLNIPQEN